MGMRKHRGTGLNALLLPFVPFTRKQYKWPGSMRRITVLRARPVEQER